jgi:hypothetical protein
MSVLYPVAASAEAALAAPIGHAARERAAQAVAGEQVAFVTEPVGPVFETEEAALDAYAGRLDDERPGKRAQVAPESRWCALRPVSAPGSKPRGRVEPVNKDGRRWPVREGKPAKTLWRLAVSYWRIGAIAAPPPPAGAARTLRRSGGEGLDPGALRALARQPLQPVKPQQPLDVGLFETRPPEAPHILMPDE